EEPFDDCFARFLDEVDTARVTALIVGCWGEESDDPASVPRDLLVEHAGRFPRLRALFLGEVLQEEAEISWIVQCDVAPLLAAFPALEELAVRGGDGLEFPATGHDALRGLVVQTGGLPPEVTTGILASRLPALEHLELWFGVEDYGRTTTVDDLAPLLAGELFPALRSLGLRNAEYTDDLVRALADAPVLRRLEVLDLSLGTLTDTGARVIRDSPAAFRRLRRLDLHRHHLSEPVMDELREALPDVDLDLGEPTEPRTFDDGSRWYHPAVTE
ncbi:STM4015 family protein, partial [Thermobifida halotolerans]|uniref:STM4015 family protein n=1 Tax=Thermobifida halotolerans TaxID=483545 RepID=UPI000838897F